MKPLLIALLPVFAMLPATPALADALADGGEDSELELPAYLQCVPYAREVSGIAIYGDAYTWWDQAEGQYARGHAPRVGAVMAFAPYGNMTLGHVAAVSKVIDSRTVLLDHANWSPIDGRRGRIERGVKAVDVSPANDWSQVRVWYAPVGGLGTTEWPVRGFIYADGEAERRMRVEPAVRVARAAPVSGAPSKQFLGAFATPTSPRTTSQARAPERRSTAKPAERAPVRTAARTPGGLAVLTANYAPAKPAAAAGKRSAPPRDRYAAVIAQYE
ncbi:CHAP domain-containing protein [Erythrobacter sp. LQ02-29]|uniref:CHAP domain-containing protein n=1 Tax=Erythrobacter sp. LQ02-29 TaxID=2920384 RepID=UPI00358EE508